ncbi:DUF342 domain-containing protein [Lutibacter sp. B2]|nr:DUF342 domain-containing protein [Lutibacter sp. B2]
MENILKLEISKDEMEAYISVEMQEETKLSRADIDEILEKNNVIYGLDDQVIDEIILEGRDCEKRIIAKGKLPENGKDGEVIYCFDVEQNHMRQIRKDGTIDFKELNSIKCVDKGAYIAEKIPATEGDAGMNIRGKEVKQKFGKKVCFKKGKNIVESACGLKLIADADGQVVLKDGKVSISNVYEINGDLDTSVGNVHFNGNVIVRGDIKSGFMIEADGDVEVYGIVGSANIFATGDIKLHKGIHGKSVGKLVSRQNIVVKYVENCYIKADGDIYADVVMHSNLEANGSIVIEGQKGLIVGGEARATKDLKANIIGSVMETTTTIKVGIDPVNRDKNNLLKKDLKEINKNLENILKVIKVLSQIKGTPLFTEKKKEMLKKSISTEQYLNEKRETINKEISILNAIFEKSKEGKVSASSTIYPGVKISIGDMIFYNRDENYGVTILKENEEIKIVPNS